MTAPADATSASRAATRPMIRRGRPATDISRVPYLPGLDGMRAFAVVAVMVYHANSDWLPGGFLGVEVFFVISGYLITLLLIAEKERTYRVDMRNFWVRRAKRLLPALFTLLIALTIWTSLFARDELGKLRGDVVAALLYVSNWYQIWTGAGYTAGSDFAPLRHLWSLAVEEQFYLVWPIVMVALLRGGSRKIADLSRWLIVAALVITVAVAVLFQPGPIGTVEITPDQYWSLFGHDIAKLDTLYLGTISRAGGLLLGAAFAMIWRPVALMRGPLRSKGHLLDGVALLGFVGLAAMTWWVYLVDGNGGNPWLFRGGFLVCGLLTLMMIAAVTHQRAFTSRVLSIPLLLWVGTRSYGLYLYHWPIYQLIRKQAGQPLRVHEFVIAMVLTAIITELSYRFVETPIRTGAWRAGLARVWRSPTTGPRNLLVAGGVVLVALTAFAGVSLATAEVQQNEVEDLLEAGEQSTCNPVLDPSCGTESPIGSDVPTPTDVDVTTGAPVTDPSGTVPPSTAETTTTTGPPVPIPKYALGDSVMLGAATPLAEQGFLVDAAVSRQFKDGVASIQSLADQGRLGDVVVVHLGTNGYIGSDGLTQMMETLADVPQVLILTVDAPGVEWIEQNNSLIYAAADTYANVELLDWYGLNDACPGDCFAVDGYHLRPDGQRYYTQLITDFLQ
jgi:peptidoglycan/LPS O-acetylase OafA/YrhL